MCQLDVLGSSAVRMLKPLGIDWLVLPIQSCLTILGGIGNVLHSAMLEHLGFPAGPLLWTIGLMAYGIASWRTGIFPRYVAVMLILFEPASILTGVVLSPFAPLRDSGSYTGGIEKAFAVMILGFALRQFGHGSPLGADAPLPSPRMTT